jgi:glycosyltransferase involved in cell wall biosynthesis
MKETNQYFANVRSLHGFLLKFHKNLFPDHICVGILKTFCIGSFPIFTIQFNPNFKKKFYLFNFPILSLPRFKKNNVLPKLETVKRSPRIYINIGSLPYFDNHSGIPRVAKELSRNGANCKDIEVLPVYPDPLTGVYRIAFQWARESGVNLVSTGENKRDPEVEFAPGDWLIHTMINIGEIKFMEHTFQFLRGKKIKIGFILHDIIAARYPYYFKSRDAKKFKQWLCEIHHYDGIFAISKATLSDYCSWVQEKYGGNIRLPRMGYFHLGADFTTKKVSLSIEEEKLLFPLTGKEYYMQVSTIEPRKGYIQLLNAFEIFWRKGFQTNLVIVGRKGWLMDRFCRRLRHHPEINHRLFWFEGVSDACLTWLYKNATAVVFASECEGFGLACVEAAFYHKPLLTRNIPVFKEVASDGTFYFDGNSAVDLEKALEKLHAKLSEDKDKMLTSRAQEPKFHSWAEATRDFLRLVKGF